jgi:hypothetical protein
MLLGEERKGEERRELGHTYNTFVACPYYKNNPFNQPPTDSLFVCLPKVLFQIKIQKIK